MRPCDTVAKYTLALCRCVIPKDDPATTLYTPITTPLVTVARNSSANLSAHAHGTKFRCGNFKNFKTSIGHTR